MSTVNGLANAHASASRCRGVHEAQMASRFSGRAEAGVAYASRNAAAARRMAAADIF